MKMPFTKTAFFIPECKDMLFCDFFLLMSLKWCEKTLFIK
ncbi:hypothetical protein PROVALCAL_01835 [Providencia alcalifaciens DSM 30120]|uniref:Uncharacterized protein n=1 Tax=Providencia alcalifaciens DSM 30120 TaxID=520999 RepID=B6XEQ4_9GAMM|nr:hypothetical protein PROVALCAL_01835 [Providencia alcalifaciens DSM 30120]